MTQTTSAIPAIVPSPPVSAVHCRLFVRYLRSRGLAPEPLLASLQLAEADLDRRDVTLPAARFQEFLHSCVQLSGDVALGLWAGTHARIEDMDLVGLLTRSAPVGSEAYAVAQRHQHVWEGTRDSELDESEEGIRCRHLRVTRHATPRVWGEYFASRTITLGRAVAGQIDPLRVRFMHPKPDCLEAYRTLFGNAELSFGEEHNEVIFSRSLLAQALPHADPTVVEVVSAHLAKAYPTSAQPSAPLPTRVRSIVIENLTNAELSLSEIARKLHQSERTLRRQLAACQTSYQTILDEVRHEHAHRYLQKGLTAAEVSNQLGFREPGSFYRAYRRWTGRSLSEFRRGLA